MRVSETVENCSKWECRSSWPCYLTYQKSENMAFVYIQSVGKLLKMLENMEAPEPIKNYSNFKIKTGVSIPVGNRSKLQWI